MNYNYGKILPDGTITYAPRVIKINGRYKMGAIKDTDYNLAGYYKLVFAEYPANATETDCYIPVYTLVDNKIIQSWELA